MASTKARLLSSLPEQSQEVSYWSPSWRLQYQTMMPSRSCEMDSLASFMMSPELEEPLEPTRI